MDYYILGFKDKKGKFWFIHKTFGELYREIKITLDFEQAFIQKVDYSNNYYPIGNYRFEELKEVFPEVLVYKIRLQPVFNPLQLKKENTATWESSAPFLMPYDWEVETYLEKLKIKEETK